MSSKDPTWISDWNPENETFWIQGQIIARRNLIWSSLRSTSDFRLADLEHCRHKLPAAGFHYTTDQLFQLVAIPGYRC